MDKEYLIKLTNDLYRLTLFFPKKEPLRYKMRELAINILSDPDEKSLEILSSFFDVALIQNWASPSEILAIKEKYDSLKGALIKRKEIKPEKIAPDKNNVIVQESQIELKKDINQRQEKILEFLKENGRAQVWQIKQILSDVTKRTLRRDFEYMLEKGIIERIGEKNDTFYKIKTE